MPSTTTSPVSGVALGTLTVLCWAGYNVAAKAGIDAGLSPAALSFLRYLTPGLVAVPLWVWQRRRWESTGLPFIRLIALAILGGPLFGLIAVAGYQFAPLSYGLLFAPVAVFMTGLLWGGILLNEPITAPRIFGAIVMFGGLALVVGVHRGGLGPQWPIGIALFVMAGCMWGSYTALVRYWRIPTLEGTAAVASLGAVIAAIALGPWAVVSFGEAEASMLLTQIIMQGLVGGVLSVVALIALLRRVPAQIAAMLPTFTPAVALFIAWAALGTRPQPAELVGAAIIFAGFMLATRPELCTPPFMRRSTP
ncbi:DMT family transporter [Roseobacter sinensis]|uniref:DMT family transporter n=1 Tax=Roseobacter sinensis TaxID=2931391 RepID=A0ABT3BIF3_9RHOB|nr:DMT family transporter [Roseobacter sp. WL0113]MCV3273349.1 DMT family transporter [Roseobacter sp. WL0113]